MTRSPLDKLLRFTFIRYSVMAVVIVAIELFGFWILNSVLGWHYLSATWLSLFIGIVLNWVGGRYIVFGHSIHTTSKEFVLVFVTSIFGVALQSSLVTLVVEYINGPAMAGKVAAIVVTFFWNYFIRKNFIYKTDSIQN